MHMLEPLRSLPFGLSKLSQIYIMTNVWWANVRVKESVNVRGAKAFVIFIKLGCKFASDCAHASKEHLQ